MKQVFIFSLVFVLLIGCKPRLSKDKLNGLWYDEELGRELLSLGDSLKAHWMSCGYEIDRNNIIVNFNEERHEIYQYLFEKDTLYLEDTLRGEIRGQYIKIPHRSTLEYEIEKKGLEIDFFEGAISPERLYPSKGPSRSQEIYFGKSIENDDELILYFNRERIQSEKEKSLNDALALYHSRNSHVSNTSIFYLDKNISFEEYAKVKNMLLAHYIYKAKFITLRQHLPYPDYDFHHYFPARMLWSESERDSLYAQNYILPPAPPPPPSLKESLNSLKPIHISWNDEDVITVNDGFVSEEKLEEVIKEKYLEDTRKTIFVYKPSPKSKVETYLFVRNIVFKIHDELKEKYALEHYDKPYHLLERDTQRSILNEQGYYLIQALDEWE